MNDPLPCKTNAKNGKFCRLPEREGSVRPGIFLSAYTRLFAAILFAISLTTASRATSFDVVINEIMYHAPFDLDDLQYIELFNRGEADVDLSKWEFTKGIHFTFPDKTRLATGGYLVVCRRVSIFSANYGGNIPAIGDFSGKLSHHGEWVELSDAGGRVIDSVKYGDSDSWPLAPDGYSASLERICPFATGEHASNWAGSKLPPAEKPAGTPGRKNDSWSGNLPPAVSKVRFQTPPPMQPATITAEVTDASGVKGVSLLWRIASVRGETAETKVRMERTAGDEQRGTYRGAIAGQPAGKLVRFRIQAVNTVGTTRVTPAPNEPRSTYSYSTFTNTNTARVPFAYVLNVSPPQSDSQVRVWNPKPFQVAAAPTHRNAAFIYMPPEGGEVLTFDHVQIRPRNGGFKVHFLKDRTFKGMTGINIIFENSPRWLLSEPMAYELYRLAGVPAPLTEHIRTWLDGRPLGYQLLIEQPNKAFLKRNKRDDTGNLYKVLWYEQGLIRQHEKRTRPATGSEDLLGLHTALSAKSGPAQWVFIRQNFNVDELINYYVVNMCIQNWDGFFNNHFLYHDAGGTGKWEMYPWDEDKTWGDYDGASPDYDWYTMPLTFGMNGGSASSQNTFSGGADGWWRPPGWFSGPLLSNMEFRKAFLVRLGQFCGNMFTEEKILPLINAMEKRLEPEIAVRARLVAEDPREALNAFHRDIQSLRNQVKYRRNFILEAIPNDRASR
jgi:hypothetical protein